MKLFAAILLVGLAWAPFALADEEAAFLETIRKNPADDTARLVYADWLEEHDQAGRAEFIRVQVELARLELNWSNPTFVKLREREGELKKHATAWLPPDMPEGLKKSLRWERGLPAELMLTVRDLENANTVRALNELRFLSAVNLELRETITGDNEAALAVRNNLRKLTLLKRVAFVKLESDAGEIRPPALGLVLSALSPVRRLWMRSHALQVFNADHVRSLNELPNLEALELWGLTVPYTAVDALGRSAVGQRLKSLVLSPYSVEPIAKSGNFPMLEELQVYNHPTLEDPRDIPRLIRSSNFSQLRALSLPHVGPASPTGVELERLPEDKNHLVELVIAGNAPSPKDFPNLVAQIHANIAAQKGSWCSLIDRLASEN